MHMQLLSKLELPGVSISLPPATHERPDESWFAGESFSRVRSGGFVQVLWRTAEAPKPEDPADPEGLTSGLTAVLREAAKRLGDEVKVTTPAKTTIASHPAVTAELTLEGNKPGRLTTWYCKEDQRVLHVLITGAALEVNDSILATVECHTWSKERRSQTLRVATFDPPEGFVRVESGQEGTLRWELGPEVIVLSFGLPTNPANALTATRRSLPPGLTDMKETLLVGPDQQPRARITGDLPGEHTSWHYTFDLLDCGERIYLATHSLPVGHLGSKPHPLERVRCPGK